MALRKKRVSRSLAHGRPPTSQKPRSMSRKASRALINSVHTLEKQKVQAAAKGDKRKEAVINAEIAALGGLEKYQEASLQGQRNDRGGDSSKVLVEWLQLDSAPSNELNEVPWRMLEVGALSTMNMCSKCGLFSVVRIDLNSQGEGILQQDFMERPLPKDDTERFDVISLSLVLNFVPDARGRGDMLLRTLEFLRRPDEHALQGLDEPFPGLFLVLPAPCVTNSRYIDQERLETIMTSLGYEKVRSKITQKLVYYLWALKRPLPESGRIDTFTKTQIRTGTSRNNFAIVLRGSAG